MAVPARYKRKQIWRILASWRPPPAGAQISRWASHLPQRRWGNKPRFPCQFLLRTQELPDAQPVDILLFVA